MQTNLLSLVAVDLNSPGKYFTWTIFQVSEANLVLILVMVVIFALALMVPFFKDRNVTNESEAETETNSASDSRLLISKVRALILRVLPPKKLLPDKQPVYVSSWIYVFGIASLAALFMAILSGFLIAIGGPDWWQYDVVGHFFNSLHLWSVELFMAFLVIHLWGKFWMAAWRGKRGLTWITGVLAFLASIVECFTGYLSQQNFDSQWISTNGKDAFNAIGLGAFFNLMNFGQMLLFHVVLIPLILIAIVGAHVLLVRIRGVSHPIESEINSLKRKEREKKYAMAWHGPNKDYDIIKEGLVAAFIVGILTILLAWILSSPDLLPVTVQSWAKVAPADFMATTVSELDGSSETALYGPPYNNQSNNVQNLGPHWQEIAGIRQPIDPAEDFVINPLLKYSADDPALASALKNYRNATDKLREKWLKNYSDSLSKVSFKNGTPEMPNGDYGPVPIMVQTELDLARSGAIDTDLLSQTQFYGTNFTKPLLFIEDGSYFASQADSQHLTGSQWGVMNETGSYPGQPWLWLYSLWYQVPGFKTSSNVDLIAIYLTGLATLLLLLVPFIPPLRRIPEKIPVYSIIWRRYYKNYGQSK
jgi:hypothetical protein